MASYKISDQNPYEALGRRLYDLRVANGWSLRVAAKLIGGLSYNRLRDFEHGTDPHSGIPTRPNEEHLRRIAKAYKADAASLLLLAGYHAPVTREPWEDEVLQRLRSLPLDQRDRLLEVLRTFEKPGADPG